MEEKINIAEILKDKPKGIRLYSPIFGECAFSFVREETDDICVNQHNGEKAFFNSKGLYNILGECLLFPSKEMRDWRKFAWKKGDVLVSNDYCTEVIFYDWYDDTYTNFYGKHRLDSENKNNIKYNDAFLCTTGRYSIEDKDAAQTYINTIEERLGGKLNRETLEIEKQPEFKDGDIVAVDLQRKNIRIFKEKVNENNHCIGKYYIGFSFNNEGKLIQTFKNYTADCSSDRLATDSEKQQLFSALEKEGKAWDSNKKSIVDLKPKVEFKPFDKVLVRANGYNKWQVSLFGYKDCNCYYCCCGFGWSQCIPYIGNESLLGTTKDMED